jgi:hypothetical protein
MAARPCVGQARIHRGSGRPGSVRGAGRLQAVSCRSDARRQALATDPERPVDYLELLARKLTLNVRGKPLLPYVQTSLLSERASNLHFFSAKRAVVS